MTSARKEDKGLEKLTQPGLNSETALSFVLLQFLGSVQVTQHFALGTYERVLGNYVM